MSDPSPIGGFLEPLVRVLPPETVPIVFVTGLIAWGLVPAVWLPYAGIVLILHAVKSLIGLKSG
ncbi:hypothetical protein GTV32_02710 [Gordonia sp. SID5947]|uniref:hypothetical protein n=1 Tax=Gordonia sp. SID5947 TaxID=2690315 RepID=UPI00136E0A22|nr:hypothetical protein [Gordonia sp. SID5947]MYR05296.1 hypothetical protein [Gordonia sp. SID5947]